MGFAVQLYIYDLSQGMARTLGQQLIGRPLEGIWHTAVVVHGKEYFFGGGGIESCNPGGTQLGQPLKIEQMGETQIDAGMFMEYLQAQGRDRFRGDRYDLLNHNCNNFSHETCQFLTGKGIPQHILDLPREVMSTPMGQMLAPMLQQMNPTGTSIPFSQGPPSAASMQPPTPASTAKLFPVSDFITFDAPLKVEGLAKKLDEFNTAQESDTKLSEEEVKVVLGIARGVVRLSKENLAILMKMQKWQTSQAFPLLDILRAKCVKPTFDPPELISQVVDLMLESLQPDHAVNSMLACKALSNLVAAGHPLSVEKVLSLLPALLPAASNNLETALASLLSNLSVALVSRPTLESAVLLASSLASSIMLDLTQDESVYRCLVCLGNTLHASHAQEEVRQLLQSMDACDLVSGCQSRGGKVSTAASEVLQMLKSGDNIDLD